MQFDVKVCEANRDKPACKASFSEIPGLDF